MNLRNNDTKRFLALSKKDQLPGHMASIHHPMDVPNSKLVGREMQDGSAVQLYRLLCGCVHSARFLCCDGAKNNYRRKSTFSGKESTSPVKVVNCSQTRQST